MFGLTVKVDSSVKIDCQGRQYCLVKSRVRVETTEGKS